MTASGEVVLCCYCFAFLLCCVALSLYISISLVELSCTSLSLEFGVIGGLVIPVYSFMLSLSSLVYQVEMLCFALICICDSAQPAELPR